MKGLKVTTLLLFTIFNVSLVSAQNCERGKHDDFLSKLISEKSNYLQEKMGLTGKTADDFSKIYYDMEMKKFKAAHEVYRKAKQVRRSETPVSDADYLKSLTYKILTHLQDKYKYRFDKRVVIGTSFGALTALFLAEKEYKNNTLGITKYISICPPVELIYAMEQVDRTADDWNKNPANLKERVAITASKIIQISQMEESERKNIDALPFSEYEAKLITGFIMHQKLSDLVYTIENESVKDKKELYRQINNMSYQNYAEKYLLDEENATIDDLKYQASLHSISDYLKNSGNYIIFHSVNDYLTTPEQLKKLKLYTGSKSVYFDNGAHLGFLYRKEFLDELKKEISLNDKENEKSESISSENLRMFID